MNDFFKKKYFFGAVFFLFILVFSVGNLIHGIGVWGELAKSMKEIENVNDLQAWLRETETKTTDAVWGKMGFIESYGGMQRILGKREFNSFTYVRDTDGMLYYGALIESETDDLEVYAERVRRLKEVVEANGAKLIVVIPPSKVLAGVSPVNQEWPVNDTNARIDKFMNLMMQNDVFAVDLRPAMQKSGEKLEDLFFKTDHHWTPFAALYGTADLVKQVEEKYGDNWDPDGYYTDLNNYHREFYEQCMLGSSGRDTGIAYAGMDDYLLLWPECDMEFTWYNYDREQEHTGDFREALFDISVMENDDIYSGSFNMIYLDEIVKHDRIVNHSNPAGPKLTVMRDSYFSPMACFLAPMCSELDMVWGRAKHNPMDFEKFVEESDADYVILEFYPHNLDMDSFDFYYEAEE